MKRTLRLILLADSVQAYFSLKYETKKKINPKFFYFTVDMNLNKKKGEDKLKS